MDELIRDKIAPHDWSAHSGGSSSIFVNASTWALMLTGKVLDEGEGGIEGTLRSMVRRLGEPVIRTAVSAAMREMGEQFVLGRTIEEAVQARPADDLEGLSLFLRHARRGGAHRGRRDALPPRLCRRDLVAEQRRDRHRHPPQSRHLGQALGAPSALRGGAEGDHAAGHERAAAVAGAGRAARPHGPQHRRRGGRPARPVARRDRAGARPIPSWPAGTALASSCRPTVRAPPSSSTGSTRWRRSSTGRSWCGWSRAPTGTPRSSGRRRSG